MENWQIYPPEHDTAGHSVTGHMLVLEKVHSPELRNQREIYVYLPPSYKTGEQRYPVLYMHDGQNLFDQATAFSGEWQVDETMEAAAAGGLEAIVVGIPNMGGERSDEYSPFVDPNVAGGGCAKYYMKFIVETLKPLIDRDFRTLPDLAHTGMVGSSMGGLVSVYGLFRHPETFGFIGAMSPSLWVDERSILEYVSRATEVMGRIYLDIGTGEGEAHVKNIQHLRDLLLSQGYLPGQELMYLEEEGAGHEEAAWARRFPQVLSFFMAPTQAPLTAS
jgi:predicted alpha/beta superfamily hydrolase